ncbi:MAG: hypothetical protein LBU17_09310 [Treponema sp.]|jgi:hypothetical protein|nr:hypothetical protein [Treponema sp.]
MKKMFMVSLVFALVAGARLLWADEDESKEAAPSIADKVSLELEFNASVLSVDSEGVVDSMTDAGFGDDASSLSVGYEDERWGATASFLFSPETWRIFYDDFDVDHFPLSIDELYVWVKPFGEHFKFTGGVFSNTDGVADYTDDIDNFGMGVFTISEEGEAFEEPYDLSDPSLTNGLLTDVAFGPVTVQLLLAPNYGKESASAWASELFDEDIESNRRLFRIGGRAIVDVGIGTLAAMVKTFQWPMSIAAVMEELDSPLGTKANFTTFGVYFDFTGVENLGISLGYTGLLTTVDHSSWDNTLWSGIDLRGTWTGIEGLSISTHNNFSFAKGAENAMWLADDDASFITIYDAVGATKELNERFSINAEVSNTFSKTDFGGAEEIKFDNLCVGAKFIAHVGEHAEFNAGLKVDFTKEGDDKLTVFSIPVGIKISF